MSEAAGRSWAWSDDPGDPCALCVHWRCDDPNDDDTVTLPSGPVANVYRGTHKVCDEAVGVYLAEVEGRPGS